VVAILIIFQLFKKRPWDFIIGMKVFYLFVFTLIVGLPCVLWRSRTKMINDLGNFPTKIAKIQTGIFVEICFIVEIVAFGMFTVFFRILAKHFE